MICKVNFGRHLFYTSLIQTALERNDISSTNVNLSEAPKLFDDQAVKHMQYYLDAINVYFYHDKFCKIYEDKFIPSLEVSISFIP